MENQHRQIKGYRELSQEEIHFMNRIKAFGPELETLTTEVANYLQTKLNRASEEEVARIRKAEAYRWMLEGKNDLQVGLMKLTRSIAQPGFF